MAQEFQESHDHINIDNTMTALSTPKYIVTNAKGETVYQGSTMPSLEDGTGHTIYILEDSVMDVQTESEVSTMGSPSEVNVHLSSVPDLNTQPIQLQNVFPQETDEENVVIESQLQEIPGLGRCVIQIVPEHDDMNLFQLTESSTDGPLTTAVTKPQLNTVCDNDKVSNLITVFPKIAPRQSLLEKNPPIVSLPDTNKRDISLECPDHLTLAKRQKKFDDSIFKITTQKSDGSIQILIPDSQSEMSPKPKMKLVPLADSSVMLPEKHNIKLTKIQPSVAADIKQFGCTNAVSPEDTETGDHCDHPYGTGTVKSLTAVSEDPDPVTKQAEIQSVTAIQENSTQSKTSIVQPSTLTDTSVQTESSPVTMTMKHNQPITGSKANDACNTKCARASSVVTQCTISTRSKPLPSEEIITRSSTMKEKCKSEGKTFPEKEPRQLKKDTSKQKDNGESTSKAMSSSSYSLRGTRNNKGQLRAAQKGKNKKQTRRFINPAPPPKEKVKKKNREKYIPRKQTAPPPGSFVQTPLPIDIDQIGKDPLVQVIKAEDIDEEDLPEASARQLKEDIDEELKKIPDCRLCGTFHNTKLCSLFTRRPKAFIKDSAGSKNSDILSLSSLPRELVLMVANRNHGLGLFSKETICRGTHFGPLVGENIEFASIHHKENLKHIWIIDTEDLLRHKFITVMDEHTSNWCRYLRSSLNVDECNLVSYNKENDHIYFVARQDINEGEELVVYYHFLEDMYEELWFNDLLNRKERYCRRCEVTFTDIVSYVKHVKIFHPRGLSSLKAECKVCHVILQSTKELTRHCVEHHRGRGAFICQDCGKHFPLPNGLRQHRYYHHAYEGDEKCEECGRVFMNKFKLKRHIKVKHSGKEFVCHHCSKKLGTRGALIRHIKMHEENLAYTCNRCGKLCRDSTNLKTHMLTHSGIKPFQCSYSPCVAGFTTKHSLISHYKNIHKLTDDNIPKITRQIPHTLEAYLGVEEEVQIVRTRVSNKKSGKCIQPEVVRTRVSDRQSEATVQTEIVYDLVESEEDDDL